MSSTRLLVLGVVRTFQPVHGYDVRRELLAWHANEWANVAPGSVYSALKLLTKERLLEVVSTDQIGGRPARTSYRITPQGENAFQHLLHEAWWSVETLVDPLMSGLAFLAAMSREELVAALRQRALRIQGMLENLKFGAEKRGPGEPAYVGEMFCLLAARAASELEWGEALVRKLESGAYETLDSKPKKPARARRAADLRKPAHGAAQKRSARPKAKATARPKAKATAPSTRAAGKSSHRVSRAARTLARPKRA